MYILGARRVDISLRRLLTVSANFHPRVRTFLSTFANQEDPPGVQKRDGSLSGDRTRVSDPVLEGVKM